MSKIAVCLSGQPRTLKYCAQSIIDYFGEVDYFCHAWDYNSYKVKNKVTGDLEWQKDSVDREKLLTDIAVFKPLDCKIESVDALTGKRRFPWDSLTYSHLTAITMKKQWEIANNFRYDWVIKGRYDLVYPHGKKFKLSEKIKHRDQYCPNLDLFTAHTGRMQAEFSQINISDVMFYGSSTAMDIAADLYWHIQREYEQASLEKRMLGPGTWMSDYISHNNLRFYDDLENLKDIVFRISSIGLSIEHDWDKIVSNHADIYK